MSIAIDFLVAPSVLSKAVVAGLYSEHSQPLTKYIASLTGNYAVAQELAQDTFVKAMKNLETKLADQKMPKVTRAWLFTIGRNLAYTHLGRPSTKKEVFEYQEWDDFAPLDLERRTSARANLVRFQEDYGVDALLLLGGADLGFTKEELGQILNLKPSTVGSRKYRLSKEVGPFLGLYH